MALTAKQLAYVQARIEGLGPSDAYRRAYDASKMLPTTVHSRANDLENHGQIAASIAAANQQAVERLQVSAQDIIERAWEIASQDKPDRVAALNLLAKRHPEFSEKHEHSGDFAIRIEALAAVAQMSAEQLRQIAQSARNT